MTSEVEERPRFVRGGYVRHRSQWVKNIYYSWTYFQDLSFGTAWRALVSHTFVFVYMQEFGYIMFNLEHLETKELIVKLLQDN